jgi:DNA-binding ferritin-like protein
MKSSRKKKVKSNKTMKRCDTSNKQKTRIVKMFLEMLNTIKLFHWKTKTYSVHKATDELYENMGKNIDRFIEVLLGKCQTRINMVDQRILLVDIQNTDTMNDKLFEYRSFLLDIDIYLNTKKDSDLLSIRDDILADINQTLYLLSFKD